MSGAGRHSRDEAVEDLIAISNLVPRLFFKLRALGERVHAEDALSVPERALLLDLLSEGAMTAPQLGALRPVSRQAIQPVLAGLLKRRLIESRPNPQHKRSPYYDLSKTGEALVGRLQAREAKAYAPLRKRFAQSDLQTARSLLEALDREFDAALKELAE